MKTIKQLTSIALIVAVSIFYQPQLAKSQSNPKGIKNIVLVHGAFADGSCWSKVVAQLQAKDYNSFPMEDKTLTTLMPRCLQRELKRSFGLVPRAFCPCR